MRERVKTILLFSLVLLGIFLTQKLWIQLPGNIFTIFESKEKLSSSYLLSDMIAPNKYLLKFNKGKYTLVYEDKYKLWDNAMTCLKVLLGSDKIKFEEITKEEYLKYQEQRSLVCYFPEMVNTYILAKAWDVNSPNNIVDTIPNITDIYIFLGNGDPFFIFSLGDKHVKAYDNELDTKILKNKLTSIEDYENFDYYYSMREVQGTQKDIYIPYEIKNSLPVVYVTNEIAFLDRTEKDLLAEEFFSTNIENIQEIVEANGSSIYVYENRFLKLSMNGLLEYYHPLEEKVTERNLYISLSNAADFINEKTKAEKGMYLAKVEGIESEESFGYRFTFRYRIRGIPIILGNKEVGEYIQMEVFNNHIRSYKHFIRRETDINLNPIVDGRKMLTSYDVIDQNAEFLVERYLESKNMTREEVGEEIIQEVTSSIEDITLAYYDPCLKDKGEKLIGVWTIRFGGKLYAFDAYTGTLVFER
ncbi:YycH family regulatory protein [Paratissierella segnis]|uniref:Regulatory protein YycH domain-containing protein n=1 Tax=Paratissierella segnis TaxID=2763679 RepID=A0A926EUU2_9FIRM|nr:YycH family regulatory protein [Paratissierella segnis]MBC8586734.1 hypothetical protein [Paratissierella segnis]